MMDEYEYPKKRAGRTTILYFTIGDMFGFIKIKNDTSVNEVPRALNTRTSIVNQEEKEVIT